MEACQRVKYGTKCSLSGAWGVGVDCRRSEHIQLMRECARTCQVDVDAGDGILNSWTRKPNCSLCIASVELNEGVISCTVSAGSLNVGTRMTLDRRRQPGHFAARSRCSSLLLHSTCVLSSIVVVAPLSISALTALRSEMSLASL